MKIIKKIFICSMLCIGLLLSASIYAATVKCTDEDFKTGAHGCKNTFLFQTTCYETYWGKWNEKYGGYDDYYIVGGKEYLCDDSEQSRVNGCTEYTEMCIDGGLEWVEKRCSPEMMITGKNGCKDKYEEISNLIDDPGYSSSLVNSKFKRLFKNAWATISVIVQIISVACVVFAGLRYMFASADQKADIKKGLMYLAIGAIFVFGTIMVIQFIIDATNEIL